MSNACTGKGYDNNSNTYSNSNHNDGSSKNRNFNKPPTRPLTKQTANQLISQSNKKQAANDHTTPMSGGRLRGREGHLLCPNLSQNRCPSFSFAKAQPQSDLRAIKDSRHVQAKGYPK